MLTRIEVDGFKNLVDFSLDLGPYTCIAGVNGVGKSNIFDAIRFLSLLTDHTINQSALLIRSSGQDTGEIGDLFFSADGDTMNRIGFAAEMIVDRRVVDDFGRPGDPSSTFLRYEVAFRREPPSPAAGPLGGLVLEREELRHIPSGRAAERLRFPHAKRDFLSSVIYNKRRGSGYISTVGDGTSQPATIVIHQDGGSSGRARPAAPAERAPRTIIGTENTAATPTILAARREMQRWRILSLEPSAMRRPDKFTEEPGITADGGHIPVTLHHLAKQASTSETDDDLPDDILSRIASTLSGLVPVRAVRAVSDDVRQLFSLELEEPGGVRLRANSISDGTLRFLALTAIAEAADAGVYCMEEPENGIHPERLEAMNRLLHDIAVDADEPVATDNPLRQVIVATHSPYFVQLQNPGEIVLAKNPAVRSPSGKAVWPLKCYPLQGSWRDNSRTSYGTRHLSPSSSCYPRMARGLRRGPNLLRFRSLVDSIAEYVTGILDARQPSKVRYALRDCYLSALAMFFVQDPSLLQFQRRFQQQVQTNNLSVTFGVGQLPSDSQFRDLLDRHDHAPILPCFAEWIARLQRAKWLQHYQLFGARYLITLDGSRYFSSESVHCEHCLSTTSRDGSTCYHHDILQAAIVHPDKREVLPLAPEFVRNSDAGGVRYRKQDCELNAGYRMLERLRDDYPRMAAIIVADSLYSKQPFVEQLTAKRLSFLLVAKPGDHRSLYQDVAGLRGGNLLNRHATEHRGERREYEWVTDLPLNGNRDAPHVNFIQFRIVKNGTVTYRNAWVTDLVPDTDNIVGLVRAARARWKIENEGFNTLKNHGYHLEHNFGHGRQHLSEAFFVLNLLAFFMHQIFDLVDGLYQRVRTFFSSRRGFWDEVRSAFRLFLFTSWDQVLVRMNSPPEPLPTYQPP